ncbi:hypothetical protein GCM10027065_23150 [Rhodanobacter koreensis]
MQIRIAAGDAREECVAKDLRLLQPLRRHAASLQLIKHNRRKGKIVRRKGRIHGIYWSVETRIGNVGDKALEGYAP